MKRSIIIGTGSYIPKTIQKNEDFSKHKFYTNQQEAIESDPAVIADKLKEITGIRERRYAAEDQKSSDIAFEAAKAAIEDSGIDPETIDQLILAHNFGDVIKHTIQSDAVPSLASRVKHLLKIKNPACTAYDILFGCPGWIQGVIQADAFGKAGMSKTALVIGTETLSRVLDHYDRDSMIFSDGAGACILRYEEADRDQGILATASLSHTLDEAYYIRIGASNFPDSDSKIRYIKMDGRKVYEYALTYVPQAMKDCLDKAGQSIEDVKQIFIHQANEKLDMGVVKRFYRLYNKSVPEGVMPMTISELGNSSVATVPTLIDLVRKGKLKGHQLNEGDIILLASVGSGMNINAVCYRV
jgi:3-oxoacyl-[acyl-carrier-protein] synthase-3